MNESILENDKNELTGCGATLACDPRRRLHRYLMLFFICFLAFGDYLCYDSPAALQDVMLQSLKITEVEFMNLYAFYSWPNVIMSFIGGILVDRVFGIPLGAVVFSTIVFVAQIIFGLGAFYKLVPLMYFARLLYGIGGESLAVSQNAYTSLWFPASELNFVFGLQLSMSRVGSTVSMNTLQKLNKAIGRSFNVDGSKQLGLCLIVASIFCVYSVLCSIVLGLFTKRAQRILKKDKSILKSKIADNPENQEKSENDISEKITLKDIVHFPGALWLICIICVAYYVTVFPFVSLGLVFFERKYQLSVSEAGVVNSLVYIVSAIASPLFGAAIDFTGKNLFWVLSSVTLTLICHLCFAFAPISLPPILIMITMGLAYSVLASSLWPLIAYLLPLQQRGTAYGLVQSVQNLGLGVISIFAGYLVDAKGYLFLEIFFTFCLSLALATTFGLFIWDQSHGGSLNESGQSRRMKAEQALRHSVYESDDDIYNDPNNVERNDDNDEVITYKL